MTSRQKKMILAAIIVVLFILLLVLIWFQLRQKPIVEPLVRETTEEPETPLRRGEKEEETVPIAVSEEEQVVQASLASLAQTFAKRYGSYSGESEFGNVEDVLGLMSSAFAERSQRMIDVGGSLSSGYYGMTTNVLNVVVDAVDDVVGTSTVSVNTQRVESIGSAQNTEVSYVTLVLTFVKEGETWKVDSAKWQE